MIVLRWVWNHVLSCWPGFWLATFCSICGSHLLQLRLQICLFYLVLHVVLLCIILQLTFLGRHCASRFLKIVINWRLLLFISLKLSAIINHFLPLHQKCKRCDLLTPIRHLIRRLVGLVLSWFLLWRHHAMMNAMRFLGLLSAYIPKRSAAAAKFTLFQRCNLKRACSRHRRLLDLFPARGGLRSL